MSVWPPGPTNPVKDHAVLFLLAGEAEEQEEAEDVAEAPLSNPRFFLARADLVWRTRERERERERRVQIELGVVVVVVNLLPFPLTLTPLLAAVPVSTIDSPSSSSSSSWSDSSLAAGLA